MRRLEAILSESRQSVNKSSSVGKTDNSIARRICKAERKTTIAEAIDSASKKSNTMAGTGISMTKIRLMAPIGKI